MAIGPSTNCMVLVNGVDLSDHASKVTCTDSRAPVDITTFGATNIVVTKGLGDGKIDIDFFQDFAAAKVHATLQPLISSTTGIVVEVRPVNAARSATNPAILMTGLLMNYNALDVKVGDASAITASFQNNSTSGVTYPTS
jgi:hypothetical protein